MRRFLRRFLNRLRPASPASRQLLPLRQPQPLRRSPGHLLFPVQSSSRSPGRAWNRSRR
jgi:hypothetical protein